MRCMCLWKPVTLDALELELQVMRAALGLLGT